ncbi:molybdenum cofactor guanylyltransferase MobA [Denitrificimonas sp. JX-1]|uniref:Molybdenum cofactor guanylyltransferase n=1 Tax=Denitrificimonas halotolerans TaxID=3098930 RepID=A0ABU5GQK5_9GAMM|nr:molybdenum cofactor guanylyltransferase MobA [Denitrificimonas sp. JX-1]MDY7218877.1 molybdenum cofactor guanylyltransferase MobA [Denitrificimonas sp. JX-1]
MSKIPEFTNCSIVLLAGGRGQRMGGRDKGWITWQGRALIEHMQLIVRSLTDDLIISCNRNQQRYQALADQLISDPTQDFSGPLVGIIEALKVAKHPQLLVLPCDAPRIDQDLLTQLYAAASDRPAMFKHQDHWQPLFSIIPKIQLHALQDLWCKGERSPKQALLQLNSVAIHCCDDEQRLANFNDPSMLQQSLISVRNNYVNSP